MFWKTYLDLSPVILKPFPNFFPPFPQINVGYFDDPSSCNTEMTFFNIDMGVEGEISLYIAEKLKNMHFPKIFAHDCRYYVRRVHEKFSSRRFEQAHGCWTHFGLLSQKPFESHLLDMMYVEFMKNFLLADSSKLMAIRLISAS